MLCRERRSIGSGTDGAFSDFIKIPADCAFHIPARLPLKEAALLEPIACCVRAVIERSKIQAGDTVYVSGPGLMGQIVAQLAGICGASVILGGVEQDEVRLRFAASKGVQTCVVCDDRCNPPQGASNRRQFAQKRALSRCIGRTKGGLNSKLHALCDGHGRPLAMTLTEGQVSDYKGAALLMDAIDALPEARELLADRGYDADWFRDALCARGITPCIPPSKSRKRPFKIIRSRIVRSANQPSSHRLG